MEEELILENQEEDFELDDETLSQMRNEISRGIEEKSEPETQEEPETQKESEEVQEDAVEQEETSSDSDDNNEEDNAETQDTSETDDNNDNEDTGKTTEEVITDNDIKLELEKEKMERLKLQQALDETKYVSEISDVRTQINSQMKHYENLYNQYELAKNQLKEVYDEISPEEYSAKLSEYITNQNYIQNEYNKLLSNYNAIPSNEDYFRRKQHIVKVNSENDSYYNDYKKQNAELFKDPILSKHIDILQKNVYNNSGIEMSKGNEFGKYVDWISEIVKDATKVARQKAIEEFKENSEKELIKRTNPTSKQTVKSKKFETIDDLANASLKDLADFM